MQTRIFRYYQIMKTQCHLSAHSNVTQLSHVAAKMRRWWICLPSTAICIVHYSARLDLCAWMGMGNWTRPGASSMQLLSLGKRSSTKSGLKSAWDTWHYQLCLGVNWEIWSPEANGTSGPVCGSLSYMCLFGSEEENLTNYEACVFCVSLWSAAWMPLFEVWCGAGLGSGGFVWITGLWCRPWTLPGTGGGGLQSSVPFSAE